MSGPDPFFAWTEASPIYNHRKPLQTDSPVFYSQPLTPAPSVALIGLGPYICDESGSLAAMSHYATPSVQAISPASSTPAPLPPPSGAPGSVNGSSSGNAASSQHKRVYQACIPCRRRKVRCDLGSVDNPNDPPCVRCRRESKECFFSATRRKRKTDEGPADALFDTDQDDYIARNGRKRLNTGTSPAPAFDRSLYSDVPLTPGGSQGRPQPVPRPADQRPDPSSSSSVGSGGPAGFRRGTSEFETAEPNQPLENLEARQVMRKGLYGPHDALDLLYKAATDNSPSHHRNDEPRAASVANPPPNRPFRTREDLAPQAGLPPNQNSSLGGQEASQQAPPRLDPQIDPQLTKPQPPTGPGYVEALKAWARFRFVRAGWFTVNEAIEYIEYYYEFLSPLTPISPPTFRDPSSHPTLLTEEPILTVTLLTIASRYHTLSGAGGHCRSHAIHEQLWTYLRGMIERVVWGQEAFGGGFCGSGADDIQNSSTAPWRGLRRGSLRTLGTIESLLMLTEWHPRSLHFPPSEAIDELVLPANSDPIISTDEDGNPRPSFGGKRIESWLEPAWRSDRMCWMLLSTGIGLGYELGVFDDIDEMLAAGTITRPEYEEETYRIRAYRIKRLLLIYLTQLAGRLGWTSMATEGLRRSDPAVSRRRPNSGEGATPGTNTSSLSNAFNYIPDLELDDQIIHCWAGISNAMHIGNERLFRSRKHTTDIIQSGRYIDLLKEFNPILRDWLKEFERFRLPPFIRHVLAIEYEYVRIYVNSLSLQAVVERCTSNAGGGGGGGGSGGMASGGGSSGPPAAQLSPQTQNYFGKLPLGRLGGFSSEDQDYVKEVVNGSRNLLRIVVEGLLPGDYLKHAPVRTYFRIISGGMFLLKTFALGAPRSDVEISIQLMDRTVDALRNCVVDDVHLGIRFADLLESLTSRLRNRFIHAVAAATDGRSPAGNQADGPNGGGDLNGQGAAQTPGGGAEWSKLPERSNTPANISATPFDLASGNFPYPVGTASIFGPPTPAGLAGGVTDNNGGLVGTGNGAGQDAPLMDNSDWNNPENEMWYLPAGPAFFQNRDNTSVAMTAEGVHVGGLDLLEYMAMDPLDGQFGGIMEGNSY